MKVITVCSDSHNELLEQHFLPSLPSTLTPVVVKTSQRGNGNHGWTPDFIAAMREQFGEVKVLFVAEAGHTFGKIPAWRQDENQRTD